MGPALYTTIAVVYLGNMIVPTAALAELGVREALLVAWMQPPGVVLPGLLAAAFLVWVVNLGSPRSSAGPAIPTSPWLKCSFCWA